VTRNHVVLGKFLGCWYASGLCLFVFYLFFAVISGAREHTWPIAHYFQGFMLHWFLLGIVTALALLGSIVFAAPSSNNTITLVVVTGILLLAGHLNKMALNLSEPMHTVVYAIYYALPHLEFFDMRELIIHNRPPVPWLVWLAALLYATVYAAIFLSATCFLFRKKAIN
jgi:ABC-type transport system involved in multi-copper enzyme maturation permease subunit